MINDDFFMLNTKFPRIKLFFIILNVMKKLKEESIFTYTKYSKNNSV